MKFRDGYMIKSGRVREGKFSVRQLLIKLLQIVSNFLFCGGKTPDGRSTVVQNHVEFVVPQNIILATFPCTLPRITYILVLRRFSNGSLLCFGKDMSKLCPSGFSPWYIGSIFCFFFFHVQIVPDIQTFSSYVFVLFPLRFCRDFNCFNSSNAQTTWTTLCVTS